SIKDHVVINLRLPKLMVGVLAGAGLAAAGTVMQGTMKNPLADPYTTGISSGASFGAALAIIGSISIFPGDLSIVGNAFVCSLIPVLVIVLVSSMKTATPMTMILSGLSVMYIFNAVTSLFMLWSNPEDTAAVYNWQIGTISSASWKDIPVMLGFTLGGLIILECLSKRINLLSSGDENARSLGVNAEFLRIVGLIVLSLMTASIVSYTGIIGFIGLVCPHIARMFVGPDNRYLIPASAAFGIAFLLFTDLVGKTIVAPSTIPVGVITAFIGGPMFLYLILRQRREVF
ncbi:MAG: iron ABC transporter permease, partial [archaeon]|nr:iron ABC transporter permease [archaeon]